MVTRPKKRDVDVTIERLYDVMMSVAATGTRDDFLKLCRERNLSVTADHDTVSAVKGHLAAAVLPGGGTAQESRGGTGIDDPQTCFPRSRITRLARNDGPPGGGIG